ncbi:MAG TPA: hypothetical protein DDZ89_06840, partial [Clostridiales bacterium]|nr:hypothetical protein [Clostridiales bacterium]
MKTTVIKSLILILFIIVMGALFPFHRIMAADHQNSDTSDLLFLLDSYNDYLQKVSHIKDGREEIVITTDHVDGYFGDVEIKSGVGAYKSPCVVTGENSIVHWTFQVAEEGLYSIEVDYYPIAGRGINIERSIAINNTIPFKEAYSISFKRRWIDQEPLVENKNGNDVTPVQVEESQWMSRYIYESSGYYNEPLKFRLQKGENTIAFQSLAEPMAIRKIRFVKYEEPIRYEQVKINYDQEGYVSTKNFIKQFPAELTLSKSDAKIRPKTDRSSPLTEPYHPSKLKLNMIGGSSWQYFGEYIEWEMDVPESGLYKLAFRFRQDLKTSSASVRKLYIDDKVPFKEVEDIAFVYNNEWQIKCLESESKEPYLFYLEKGSHKFKLEVTLGEISGILKDIEDTILALNEIYRNFIVYTGTNPDPYTDYILDRIIPETIQELADQGEKLYKISEEMKTHGAVVGTDTSFIDTCADLLMEMYEDPYSINHLLNNFKTNIGSLGTWLNELTINPLKLDSIMIASPEMPLPKAKANLLSRVLHEVKAFFGSFKENYSLIESSGKQYDDNITVWLNSVSGLAGQTGGRDQALLLKSIIESGFSDKTNIGVDIKLVDGGAMLPAILAGNAPDVAISVSGGIPVQYGLRSAIADLREFNDFDNICARFPSGAFMPVTYNGIVYGMPENLSWDMLFYRKDILYELGIELPETWGDMINLIPILAKNNMEIGISTGNFYTFLYQNGLEIYNPVSDRCLLDQKEHTGLFADFTNLFVNYRLPVSFNMLNRFRTGEMPLVVAPYNTYNTMVIFAPEIRGLWDFAMIPGTERPDGTIDRTTICSGTYTMMFK